MQAESIGASSMRIARKTAKLFTCLGGSSQLGHTIVPLHVSVTKGLKYHILGKNVEVVIDMKVEVANDRRVVVADRRLEAHDKRTAAYAEELQYVERSQYWRLVYQPFELDVSAQYQRPA